MADDMTPLKEKLARLAANDDVYEDGARVLPGETASDKLKAILLEIDDTVLSSALTLTSGDASVTMNVGGRRMMGISALSDGLTAQGTNVAGAPLAADDSALMDSVASVMQQFSETEGTVLLRSEPAPKLGGTSDVGPTPKQLRSLWLDEVELPDGSPMEQFLILTEDCWSACLFKTDDTVTQDSGETEALATYIDTQFAAFATARAERLPKISDPSLTLWVDPTDAEQAIGYAMHNTQIAGFMCPVAAMGKVVKNWNLIA